MALKKTGKGRAERERKVSKKTKAQERFEEYKSRVGATAAAATAGGAAGTSTPGLRVGPAMPAWGYPPSVAPFAQSAPQEAFAGAPMAVPAATAVSGSASERLGSTLRLGVEVVNASLGNGLRLLEGLTGMTSELGGVVWPHAGGHCGCGGGYSCGCSCCCDPCLTECGCHDCCHVLGCGCQSCEPSVGTCC